MQKATQATPIKHETLIQWSLMLTTVHESGPALIQHWVNVSSLADTNKVDQIASIWTQLRAQLFSWVTMKGHIHGYCDVHVGS